MTSCRLNAVLLSDVSLCVSTPLGSGTVLDKVCKNVDVMLFDVHLPVDMLILPIFDFDVILGMNWLNQYRVVIDYPRAVLSFNLEGREFSCNLLRQRPPFMPTMELWERPRLVALSVSEDELKVDLVPIARDYVDVFPDDLPGLPPDREIEFRIDLLPSSAPIAKQAYLVAPAELR